MWEANDEEAPGPQRGRATGVVGSEK